MSQQLTSAAGYIRMSSDRQEKSPAQQKDAIQKLAKANGYEIVKTYKDEAISGGKIEERPGFMQMIEDAKAGRFSAVLAWSLDRIGRLDLLRAGRAYEPLRDAGVILVTQVDGTLDLSTFAGRLQTAVISEARADFLVSLSSAVLRGKIESASKGHWLQGALFGYDRVYFDTSGKEVHVVRGGERFTSPSDWHCQLRINEDEASFVREMYKRYAEGEGLLSIKRWLDTSGASTRRSAAWSHAGVRHILQNPIYCGRVSFGKNRKGSYRSIVVRDGQPTVIDRRLETGDEETVFESLDESLAIVDDDTWQVVQAGLERSSVKIRHRSKGRTMLGGVIMCHDCNCPIYGDKKHGQAYYRCKGCNRARKASLIEPLVLEHIQDRMLSPQAIAQLKKIFQQQQRSQTRGDTTVTLKKKRDALRKSIAQAETNLLSVSSPALVKRLEVRIEEMTADLSAATETLRLPQPQSPKAKWADVEKQLDLLAELLETTDTTKLRAVIDGLPGQLSVEMLDKPRVFWDEANGG